MSNIKKTPSISQSNRKISALFFLQTLPNIVKQKIHLVLHLPSLITTFKFHLSCQAPILIFMDSAKECTNSIYGTTVMAIRLIRWPGRCGVSPKTILMIQGTTHSDLEIFTECIRSIWLWNKMNLNQLMESFSYRLMQWMLSWIERTIQFLSDRLEVFSMFISSEAQHHSMWFASIITLSARQHCLLNGLSDGISAVGATGLLNKQLTPILAMLSTISLWMLFGMTLIIWMTIKIGP